MGIYVNSILLRVFREALTLVNGAASHVVAQETSPHQSLRRSVSPSTFSSDRD